MCGRARERMSVVQMQDRDLLGTKSTGIKKMYDKAGISLPLPLESLLHRLHFAPR